MSTQFPPPYIPKFVDERFIKSQSASLVQLARALEKRIPASTICGNRWKNNPARDWEHWLYNLLDAYRMNKFIDINDVIRYRGPHPNVAADEYFDGYAIYGDYIMARSLTYIMTHGFARSPYDVWVYRGAYFAPEKMQTIVDSKNLTFDAILSTTTNIDVAMRFAKSKYGYDATKHESIIYAMLIPAGTPCSDFVINRNDRESEIMFPPNMKASIIHKDALDDGTFVVHCVMNEFEPSPICPTHDEFVNEMSIMPCFMYGTFDQDERERFKKEYDTVIQVLKRLDSR